MPPGTGHLVITTLAHSDSCAVLRVSGDLDYASELSFMAALGDAVDAGYRYLVLDVTALVFCDSRGLNCLLALRWLLHRRPGALLLVHVGRRLTALLAQTGSTDLFPSFLTVRHALETVPESSRPVWPPTADATAAPSGEQDSGS
ncbi:STAS domain-containing protein [Streptomyces sp. NPDC054796]|uniref:STAS domain-containing protein n=1 Tax=Streptomyces daliensis TaxID=299421 RepID=A0A8T4J1P0_9ACTN|nr:STAS domain-containing protein [Streptomyces daliensis]